MQQQQQQHYIAGEPFHLGHREQYSRLCNLQLGSKTSSCLFEGWCHFAPRVRDNDLEMEGQRVDQPSRASHVDRKLINCFSAFYSCAKRRPTD